MLHLKDTSLGCWGAAVRMDFSRCLLLQWQSCTYMIINYIVLVSAIHIKDYMMYHAFKFCIFTHQTQETIPFYLPPPTLNLPLHRWFQTSPLPPKKASKMSPASPPSPPSRPSSPRLAFIVGGFQTPFGSPEKPRGFQVKST